MTLCNPIRDGIFIYVTSCKHVRFRATSKERTSSVLMEVFDAVDVVGGVHGEGYPIQAAVTHHAGEAVRVVGLSCRTQDALHDGLAADVAGLQGVLWTNTQLDNTPNEDQSSPAAL